MKRSTLIFCFSFTALTACVDSSTGQSNAPTEDFDFVAMMANYADEVIVPSYERFEAEAAELAGPAGAIANYCGSIDTVGEAAARSEARDAWRATMSAWQESEVFLVGPVTDNGGALRSRIYSFFSGSPISTCAIDQTVVLAQEPGFDLQTRSFNQRGLDGIEYLLFNDDLGHTCPAQIVATQDWDLRTEAERKFMRCEYAYQLADDIVDASQELVSAWQPNGNNYRSVFVNPDNIAETFQTLSEALFYIELETKDAKLGVPTGINDDCSQLTCPTAAESPFSDTTLENIRANLIGFRNGLSGGNGLGFDDLITDAGFSSVNQNFFNNIDTAIALIDSMNTPLLAQLEGIEISGSEVDCLNSAANPDTVQTVPACSLHGMLKRITDSLRTEFIVIVDVDLPDRAGGDND